MLSERYPEYIWLASGGLGEVQVDKFRPLRGRKIIMMPDTDTDGMAFKRWNDAAQAVMTSWRENNLNLINNQLRKLIFSITF